MDNDIYARCYAKKRLFTQQKKYNKMATVKAIVRSTREKGEANVQFRLSDGRGVQLYHTSDIKIDMSLWDAKGECVKKRALCVDSKRRSIDKAISDRKNLIMDIYTNNRSYIKNSEDLNLLVDRELNPEKHREKNDFIGLYERFMNSLDIADSTKKQYNTVRDILDRYVRFRIYLDASFEVSVYVFDSEMISDFSDYIGKEYDLSLEYPNVFKNIISESGGGSPKPRGHNRVCGVLGKLSAFFNWCVKNDIINKNPFSKYDGDRTEKYGTPFYLTIEERNRVDDFDISSYSKRLVIFKDIFIFQCLVGCRISDLKELTEDNVVNGILTYVPQKTKRHSVLPVRVPLVKRAINIIEKYKSDGNGGHLLPQKSMSRCNSQIKRILKICGIDRKVTVINPLTQKEESRPIYEIASTHMARRTFIGNLYKKVKDPNLIASMSGHVEGSSAFSRYRTIDDDIKRETISLIE